MKKNFKIFLSLIFILTFTLTNIFAITVTDWKNNLTVTDGGGANISEEITYDPDGKINGVYRTINVKAEDINITKVSVDGTDYTLKEDAKKGDEGVYTLKTNDDQVEIKVFKPTKAPFTLTLRYEMNGVIEKGKDFGHLWYSFFNDNDGKVNNMEGTITFPGRDTSSYEVYRGVALKSGDTFTIRGENIKSNGKLELDILFDVNEFENYSKEIDVTKSEYIEEIQLNEIKKEQNANRAKDILAFFSGIFSLLAISSLYFYRKIKNKFSQGREASGELTMLSPALAVGFIRGNYSYMSMLLATLLDFERKGIVKISEEKYLTKKGKERTNIIFTKTGKVPELKNENYLYNWLFEDKDTFETRTINEFRTKDAETFYQKGSLWTDQIRNELKDMGLIPVTKSHTVLGALSLIAVPLLLVLSLVSIMNGVKMGYVILPSLAVLTVVGIKSFSLNTPYGREQFNKWNELLTAFGKKDFNMEGFEDKKDDVMLYRIALGNDFKQNLEFARRIDLDTNTYFPFYWTSSNGRSVMQSTINRTFTGSSSGVTTSSTSSPSGGGGTGSF